MKIEELASLDILGRGGVVIFRNKVKMTDAFSMKPNFKELLKGKQADEVN